MWWTSSSTSRQLTSGSKKWLRLVERLEGVGPVPTACEIITFTDDAPPPGASPWVVPPSANRIDLVVSDPSWPDAFDAVADRLRNALGGRVLDVIHVGSTSVPGLDAKPVIDVDLIVADPSNERAWLPALESAGFVLAVREPWWHEHRLLNYDEPRSNIHVFAPSCPEPWKHRIFRDHLRRDEQDRALYAKVKRDASERSNAGGEATMGYNRRKQDVIRDIYERAFAAAGLL